jgi:hypothetical protein
MLLKVICISEPDISYTRNKKLTVGEYYLGEYKESDLKNYGTCRIYDIYDMNKNRLGQYFARDFETILEYRERRLEEILN